MKTRHITFHRPEEVTNPGDDSRSFLFTLSCVDSDLVGSPEEERLTSEHRLIVTVANNRLPAWAYSDPELIKVLFEIGRREVAEKVKTGSLGRETRVLVHTESHSSTRPYDPSRIAEPQGAVIEVEEQRTIGFK